MQKLTIVLIPENARQSKQIKISKWVVRGFIGGTAVASIMLGYLVYDYLQLRTLRSSYQTIATENQGLRGEANLLLSNLEEVKRSLKRVQEYSEKLGELTQIKVKRFSVHTGIGPLSPQEYSHAKKEMVAMEDQQHIPVGIDLDRLMFRTVFENMKQLGNNANQNALRLQKLLSTLSQQKSLLASVPSISPVEGWVTSGFGARESPFTKERDVHMGLDIAAPIGSPFYAPADGVVIYAGKKDGFGNFIMIAHGYGVISRFGHNAENLVEPGQKVVRGEQIGTVGMTGRTTGPHLHYEVMLNGANVDPSRFILSIQ
ncbi:MAG: M23 family metallopeptidase [Proteobacteria bacterium]|nr:MAG: M23 family metallopeptidase [Pseudomonadota bacterium]